MKAATHHSPRDLMAELEETGATERGLFTQVWGFFKKHRKPVNEEDVPKFRNDFINVMLAHVVAVLLLAAFTIMMKSGRAPKVAQADWPAEGRTSAVTAQASPPTNSTAQAAPTPSAKLLSASADTPSESKPSERLQATGTESRSIEHAEEENLPPVVKREAVPVTDGQSQQSPPLARQIIPTTTKAEATPGAKSEPKRNPPMAQRLTPQAIPTPAPKIQQAPAPSVTPVSLPQDAAKPAPVARPSQYTVTAGDNLFRIARRLDVDFAQLAAANKLGSPRDLKVGQVLIVP